MITIECDCGKNGCGTRMEKFKRGRGFDARDNYECPKCKKMIEVREL